ncbi:MAG: putative bifunctional diguanylate cyclase/phosphodiesterase [Oscillospiraceae bacterium]
MYNYTELEEIIKRVGSVFDVVKIVDPAEYREIIVDNGEVKYGGNCFEMLGKNSPCFNCPCKSAYETGKTAEKYEAIDGSIVHATAFPVEFTDQNGNVRKYALDLLNYMSKETLVSTVRSNIMVDLMTGIPNLSGFLDLILNLIVSKRISEYDAFFFNIHNFKFINNIFTYEEGNSIMSLYADNIVKTLEKDELLARVGGDNFVAAVRKENAERFIDLLGNVEVVVTAKDGQRMKFGFSAKVGAAHLDEGIRAPGEVMRRTTTAYQSIKRVKDIRSIYFTPDLFNKMIEMQGVIHGFDKAIEEHEFVIYYQPKVELGTNRIIGAEALVRWNRDGVIIAPGVFIPTLEKENKICELDYYVLEEVCRMLRRWQDAGKELVCISSNFSRKHLEDPGFVEKVLEIVDRYGIDHKYIEIELTESEEFSDYGTMSVFVEKFRQKGFKTSIDDFGTGYSTLKMLQRTSLDIVKIDRSFIPLSTDYPEKEKAFHILRDMVNMTRDLGMKVIAEGVEDNIQLGYLKDINCDFVQGYVFDKPLPESEFEKRVNVRYYDRGE